MSVWTKIGDRLINRQTLPSLEPHMAKTLLLLLTIPANYAMKACETTDEDEE